MPCACCGAMFKPWKSNQKYCSEPCRRAIGIQQTAIRNKRRRDGERQREYAAGIDALVTAAQTAWSDANPCAGNDENMIYGNMVTL